MLMVRTKIKFVVYFSCTPQVRNVAGIRTDEQLNAQKYDDARL